MIIPEPWQRGVKGCLNTLSFILNTLRPVMHLCIDYNPLQKEGKEEEEKKLI